MSCGTLRFTIRELESRVSYPPPKKKVLWQEPHRSAESRRLVDEYRAMVAAEAKERQKYAIASAAGAAATIGSSSSKTTTLGGLTSKTNPHAMIAAANQAEEEQRVDDAIGCLLEALRICNATGLEHSILAAEVNERIGMHHVDKELYHEAITYFTAGVSAEPTFSRNYLHRAECYVLLDESLKAFNEYEKYFKLELPAKSQLVRCGKCALEANLLEESEKYLLMTLECVSSSAPQQASPHRSLDGDTADAANDAYAYYNLGELEEKRGRDELAREYFAKVSVVDPEFYVPYEDQAEDEYASGNYTMALHLFESLAKILPNDAKYFVRLADVYEKLGEEFASSVLMCLSKALELKQDRDVKERTLVRRGRLLFYGFQQLDDSIADFTSCLSLNAKNHEALNLRALAYRERATPEDLDAAVADYKVLVALEHVPFATKAEPHIFLAADAFAAGNFAACAKYYSLAMLFLGDANLSREDTLRMQIALASAATRSGDTFDELYEPRGWPSRDANEKGKKADASALKGPAVPSLAYTTVDQWYVSLRDREPTMHSELEYQLIAVWKPFRDEVERKREEAEAVRLGKKPKGKK